MLYIFDLDDTLIPTSDVITPVRLAKIAIRYGLTKAQKDRLEALNAKALYSKDALLAFAEEMGIDMPQVEDNLEGVERRLVNLACLRELPYEKAIVTAGDERLQQEKIDFFGVDRGLFKDFTNLFNRFFKTPRQFFQRR